MAEDRPAELTRADVADIQTARLTIERHLNGDKDADLARAAAMLRAVLERHRHPSVTSDATTERGT